MRIKLFLCLLTICLASCSYVDDPCGANQKCGDAVGFINDIPKDFFLKAHKNGDGDKYSLYIDHNVDDINHELWLTEIPLSSEYVLLKNSSGTNKAKAHYQTCNTMHSVTYNVIGSDDFEDFIEIFEYRSETDYLKGAFQLSMRMNSNSHNNELNEPEVIYINGEFELEICF